MAPGHERMRTLDISRVNQQRHKWQRIDTFRTPYGNGQAAYDGDRVRERSTALAGLGLEMEQLRCELNTSIGEVKEELSQRIETLSELLKELLPMDAPPRESAVQGLGEVQALHAELRGSLELCREQSRALAAREEREMPVDQARKGFFRLFLAWKQHKTS